MSTVRSMTGFSNVERSLADGRQLAIRLKSVNGRHLELQLRLPPALEALEPALRSLIKAEVRRGHVELVVHAERLTPQPEQPELQPAVLAGLLAAHRAAAQHFGISSEPDLNSLLRLPGVLAAPARHLVDETMPPALLEAAAEAVQRFSSSREQEGAALAAELHGAIERLQQMALQAAALRRQVTATAVERLQQRLYEVAGEHVDLPPERVLAEAALLAARGDVEEELVRLQTHLSRFRDLLDGGGELGKPLEFLLQELGRETNTLLSKSSGAAGDVGLQLTDLGLAMKVELERAREQVMNLE